MIDALGNPQSVLVLGGASDIATATVARLIADRCRTVVLAGRRPEVLDKVAGELRRIPVPAGESVSVETMGFDAYDRAAHQDVITTAFDRPGGIDVVIVAFAILGDQRNDEEDPQSALKVLEVNFLGGASACMWSAAALQAQGSGVLVVLSSIAGERVRRANYVYGASKAGIDGFAQGLGDAMKGSGASLMIVRPGFVHTKMTTDRQPAPFSTTPDAVAEVIVRGIATGAEIVWAPPILRWMMTVMRHLPRAVFRRIKA